MIPQTFNRHVEIVLADLDAGEVFALANGCHACSGRSHERIEDALASGGDQGFHQGQRLADLVQLATG